MICYPIGAFDEGSSVGLYGYEFVHAQVKLGEWKKKFKILYIWMIMYGINRNTECMLGLLRVPAALSRSGS